MQQDEGGQESQSLTQPSGPQTVSNPGLLQAGLGLANITDFSGSTVQTSQGDSISTGEAESPHILRLASFF